MTDIFTTPGASMEDLEAKYPEVYARRTNFNFATYADDAEMEFAVLLRLVKLPPGAGLSWTLKACWEAYNKEMQAPRDPGALSSGPGDAQADPAWVKDLEQEINEARGCVAQADPTESYVTYAIEKAFDTLVLGFGALHASDRSILNREPLLDGYYRAKVMDLAALMATVPEHMRVEVFRRLAELCQRPPSSEPSLHALDCLAIDFWCQVTELYVETLSITAGRRVGRDSPPEVVAFSKQVDASRNEMLKMTRACQEARIRAAAGGVTRTDFRFSVRDALSRPTAVAPPRRRLQDLDPATDYLESIEGHLYADVHPVNRADFGDAFDCSGSEALMQPVKANAIARIDETRQAGCPTWHPLPGKRHVTRTGRVTSRLWRARVEGHFFLTDGHYSWLPDGRIIGCLIAHDARQLRQMALLAPYDLVAVYEGDVVREPMVKTLSGQPIDPPELEC